MPNEKFNMVLTYSFDAPLENVWNMWHEPAKVMQWWGPKGFTCPVAKMDFREGGVSLVCMRAPASFGGQDFYNTWNYQKIVPLQRLEYVLRFSDKEGNQQDPSTMGLPPGIPMSVPHVITFKKLTDNKTEITVEEFGYASEQATAISKAGMVQCLDKMAEALAT